MLKTNYRQHQVFSSLEMLERTGCKVEAPEALELLKQAGCYVNGDRVKKILNFHSKFSFSFSSSSISFHGYSSVARLNGQYHGKAVSSIVSLQFRGHPLHW